MSIPKTPASKTMVFLILTLIFAGCAHAPAGLAPSTTPVDLDKITVLGHASGEMSYFSLLGLFPFGKPDYEAAIQKAVQKYQDGKAMINVRSSFTSTYVVVGFIHKLEVSGDVITF